MGEGEGLTNLPEKWNQDSPDSRLSFAPSRALFLIKGRSVKRRQGRDVLFPNFLRLAECRYWPASYAVTRLAYASAKEAAILFMQSLHPSLSLSLFLILLMSRRPPFSSVRDISVPRNAHPAAFLIGINGGNVEAAWFKYHSHGEQQVRKRPRSDQNTKSGIWLHVGQRRMHDRTYYLRI